MLSLPSPLRGRKAIAGTAAAVLAALAVAGPANAATGVESTAGSVGSGGATTSFHFVVYSSGAADQDAGFTMIERKAG